jgi:sulfite oxidase
LAASSQQHFLAKYHRSTSSSNQWKVAAAGLSVVASGLVVTEAAKRRRAAACEAPRSTTNLPTQNDNWADNLPTLQTKNLTGSTNNLHTLGNLNKYSIVTLNIEKDRPGILNEASELLRKHMVEVKDASITTSQDNQAKHVYTVADMTSNEGVSANKLDEIRRAMERLEGGVVCTVSAWPTYTRDEVALHTTKETGIWVTYKNHVYDITNFIANHPGGHDKIMLAAGKAIDPFWRIYQQHEGRGNAVNQLATMCIGDLADPVSASDGDETDPYDQDPDRHPGLIFHNNKPCNAEVPVELMMDSWLTPNPVWFIRHHHPVPVIDAGKYRLQISGFAKPINLTLEDLKSRFLKKEVVSTIQCGGNRRSEMDKVEKTSGIPWGIGACSTARWGGVYLREVLMHCIGLSLEAVECNNVRHVIFHGLDDMQASIPIEKALSPYGDVLLAYEMNGEPLPPEHGYPIRLVAPGVVGVRNVKWVGRIEVSSVEAQGPWQRGIAYKGFSPNVKAFDRPGSPSRLEIEQVLSIQEMPIQSSIISPKPGATVTLDDIEIRGFAWSGGGRGIVRVDVSADDGQTWWTADLLDGSEQHPTRAWAWTFWEAVVPVPDELRGKEVTIMCKATDSSYNCQPERPEPIWNVRGLNCNCWHRVELQHDDSD